MACLLLASPSAFSCSGIQRDKHPAFACRWRSRIGDALAQPSLAHSRALAFGRRRHRIDCSGVARSVLALFLSSFSRSSRLCSSWRCVRLIPGREASRLDHSVSPAWSAGPNPNISERPA